MLYFSLEEMNLYCVLPQGQVMNQPDHGSLDWIKVYIGPDPWIRIRKIFVWIRTGTRNLDH